MAELQQFSHEYAFAYGTPSAVAEIKHQSTDFIVVEKIHFELSGEGEHRWIYIEKTELTTQDVIDRLQKLCRVRDRLISYSGLKDKYAVTRQWLCIPAKNCGEEHLQQGLGEGVEILKTGLHHKKLKRGTHKLNHFDIRLRNVTGDYEQLQQRLELIKNQGVPNYFGEQRFGFAGQNLNRALQLFDGRLPRVSKTKQGLYYSAARSYLFNHIVSQRVALNTWNTYENGDVLALNGSKSVFRPEQFDADLYKRLQSGDVHISGLLFGADLDQKSSASLDIESALSDEFPEFCQGLLAAGLKAERRALRLMPQAMSWNLDPAQQVLELSFDLAVGAFATAVLRELIQYSDVNRI